MPVSKADLLAQARMKPLVTPTTPSQAAKLQRKLAVEQKKIASRLEKIRKLQSEVTEHDIKSMRLAEAIRTHAEEHRRSGQMSVHLPNAGSYEWDPTARLLPVGNDEEAAIRWLEANQLGDYVRVEKSIDKEKILADKLDLKKTEGVIELVPGELFKIHTLTPLVVKYDPYEDKYLREAAPKRANISGSGTKQAA